MKTKRVVTWLAAGAGVLAGSAAVCAAPPPGPAAAPHGLDWMRQIGDEAGDDAGQALAWSSADGGLIVAGFSTPRDEAGVPGSFWLRRLDGSGEVRQTTRIPFGRGQGPVSRAHRYIGGLVILPGGDALVVVEMGQLRPVLVRVGTRGDVVFSKPLAEHSTSIARLVPAEQGRYLLVGRQGQDAFAMKVDADGQAIWTRQFDRGENEGFTDAVPAENGGFVAVGSSRGDDPAKGQRVWIVRANADGVRQTDATFAGREGALAKAPDGTLRVVYDAQTESFVHDVWLVELDAGLKTLAKTRLLDSDAGFPVRLGIVAHPRGGFLVAGAKGLGLWLQRVDSQGRPSWNWSDSPEQAQGAGGSRAWHQWFEALAASRDAVFVLSSVQRVDAKTSSSKVGLLKLVEP